MFLCKQAEKGVPLQPEQGDWLEDTDEEINEQELEAHYSFIAKIQELHYEKPESINDTHVVEKDYSNVNPDSSNMCDNDNQADQNAEECDDEHVVLANLIANLKLDTDENKKIQNLEKSNRTRDRYLGALHDKVVELEKYIIFKDRTMENDTLERKLKETLGLLAQKEHDIQKGLKIKAYEVSVVKEKNNELVQQSLLTKSSYEGIVKEKNKRNKGPGRVTSQINNTRLYLKKAQSEKPCLYEFPYDKCDLANLFAPDREETLTLELESISKLNTDLVKPYDYTKENSLYEIFKPLSREYLDQLIVHLVLFIVDSGCTKRVMGNLTLLCNFVEQYLGNIMIKRVYYIEGLNNILFSIGQFCDADLEVAFQKSTCFMRDLQGNDLLTDNYGSDLYTISLQETSLPASICFLAKASPTQAWLWHQILSHLNFDTINLLSKKDIVNGLPKLKYVKD
ncbi:retrovirus-related pol polyprotein from transposon TNT 1-94 [Tanacetum coccineum]